jgi:CelD/BcsL family acetyltransferase involved in cellulose biosynthesis
MRIVLHRDIPDDPLLQQRWNALAQEMESPQIFYTHQWALAVSRAYCGSVLPLLLLAYEGEKLTGVAALASDPDGKTAVFLCSTTADYCDLVSRPEHRAELLNAVLAELGRAGLPSVVFTSIPAESATMHVLASAARTNGYHLAVRPTAVCAQVDLGSQEQRASLKSALGKKKIFRYSMNSLGREGTVSFSHLATWEAIQPVLTSFSVAHVARFLAMGRISNVVTAQRRAFLSELARLLSASGWLVLSRMLVEDRAVAWNYGFQFQGSWFWYQPTFDTSYERLSPGYCLLSKIITEACDHSEMRVVDLGLGAEGYKERFANSFRATLHASLTKSLDRHARELVRYYAGRAVTHVPGAETAVRGVLNYIGERRRGFEQGSTQSIAAQRVKLLAALLNNCEEFVFYQWRDDWPTEDDPARGQGVSSEELRLHPLELETLAIAAMSYEKEADTLSYLLRSARRSRLKKGEGFVLLDADGPPLHFCWVQDFEGFGMNGLKTRLNAPSQNAAIIFDCWTPQSKRRRGYFRSAISLAAQHLSKSGKEPWIFSAAGNSSAGRSIEEAGFERRYSMIWRKTLAWQRVSQVTFNGPAPAVEAQARS